MDAGTVSVVCLTVAGIGSIFMLGFLVGSQVMYSAKTKQRR